jgi:hypothetical protein
MECPDGRPGAGGQPGADGQPGAGGQPRAAGQAGVDGEPARVDIAGEGTPIDGLRALCAAAWSAAAVTADSVRSAVAGLHFPA